MTRRALLSLPFISPAVKALGWPSEAVPAERLVLVYVDWGFANPGIISGHEQVSDNPVIFAMRAVFTLRIQRMSPSYVGAAIGKLCQSLSPAPSVALLSFERDAFHRTGALPSIADAVTNAANAAVHGISFEATHR